MAPHVPCAYSLESTHVNESLRARIDGLFTARHALAPGFGEPASPAAQNDGPETAAPSISHRVLRAAAWPLALVLIAHRILISAVNGSPTDDFTTVYSAVRRMLAGDSVYAQAYDQVDPLYLYNPGATLLLTPLGLADNPTAARMAFILANAACIIVALALLTRLVNKPLSGATPPIAIALACATESVTNTLTFSNINGVLLLLLTGWLYLFIRGAQGQTKKMWLAGLVLGIAILVKPQFAPLLALHIVKLDWKGLVGGIGVPVLTNVIAWPLVPGTEDFTGKLLPYLGTTRDYANSSWPGVNAYFQLNSGLYYTVWTGMALIVAAGLIALLRRRHTDVALWAMTTAPLVLVGVFFLSSLGQQYYSMWIAPLLFTIFARRNALETWLPWLGAVLCLAPMSWTSVQWPDAGRWMSFFAGTAGWAFVIIGVSAAALGWWAHERVESRHD